ncbi:hypothetical protein BLA39750_00907 [Burkholderia lata]|uniref:Uncharacterized protein n=1 Tax=Burkholderia lata (strain ATCC 17760 / DSM 23089 / LMG 22485 / NCIMB 9086 / R18194 / 383) TaxID=482957 RepID=A0A6P2UN64_BURL3|nr:hypothetical protein BLA39750_00907 [Burkholderia lata]
MMHFPIACTRYIPQHPIHVRIFQFERFEIKRFLVIALMRQHSKQQLPKQYLQFQFF